MSSGEDEVLHATVEESYSRNKIGDDMTENDGDPDLSHVKVLPLIGNQFGMSKTIEKVEKEEVERKAPQRVSFEKQIQKSKIKSQVLPKKQI